MTSKAFKYAVILIPFMHINVYATIINVPGDYPSIQTAIDSSSNGDTVLVQPETYYEQVTFNGHNVVLGSLFLTTADTSYISSTILDGQSIGYNLVRFVNGEDSTAVITGFTIRNGLVAFESGGGISCNNSSPTICYNKIIDNQVLDYGRGGGISCDYNANPIIRDNLIAGNSAIDPYHDDTGGGAIGCSYNSNPIICNNTISGNSASMRGGGIYCNDSNPTIIDNTISGDSSTYYGGGICCSDSAYPVISDNTLFGNTSGSRGGGIYCTSGAYPTISHNTITENVASYGGGGISCYDSDPIISDNTIAENQASHGGGIYCENLPGPVIYNNVISGNIGDTNGGGILITMSAPEIVGNEIIGNSALLGGAGIRSSNSNTTIRNNTISGNYATPLSGSGIECYNSSDIIVNNIVAGNTGGSGFHLSSGSATITFCDFFNNQNGNLTGISLPGVGILDTVNANGDSCDIYFNIFLDPLFADTANGDYQLTWANFPVWDETRSPCIDAGDPASPFDPDSTVADMGALFFDQRVPDLELSATSLDFGTVTVGNSSDLPLMINNVGGDTLVLYDILCGTTVFSTNWNPADSLVLPGDSLEVTITFTPDDSTSYEDTLCIANNCEECRVPLSGIGEIILGVENDPSSAIPDEFALWGPYPNPFNPVTMFKIELPAASWVRLEIYDISGRSQGSPLQGWRTAGYHDVIFDAAGMASGVYVYRLEAGEFRSSGKMVLLK